MRIEYQLDTDDWVAYYAFCQLWASLRRLYSWWNWLLGWSILIFLTLVSLGCIMLAVYGLFYVLIWYAMLWGPATEERAVFERLPLPLVVFASLAFLVLEGIFVTREMRRYNRNRNARNLEIRETENWLVKRMVASGLQNGNIKLNRRYEVTFNSGGFTEVVRLREDGPGAGLEERSETAVRWGAVEAILTTERHAFVIVRASGTLIVPKRAFQGEMAFQEFVSTLRRWHEASPLRDAIRAAAPAAPVGSSAIRSNGPKANTGSDENMT